MFCPVSAHARLVNWMWRYSISVEVAAAVLGVSRRTVYRWLAKGRAPVLIAHCLDQIYEGPWIGCSLRRGTWHACRDNQVRRLIRSVVDGGSVRSAHRASPDSASLQPAAPAKPSKSLAVPPSRRPGNDPRTPGPVEVNDHCLNGQDIPVLGASMTVRRPTPRPHENPVFTSLIRSEVGRRTIIDPPATPGWEEVQTAFIRSAADRRVTR